MESISERSPGRKLDRLRTRRNSNDESAAPPVPTGHLLRTSHCCTVPVLNSFLINHASTCLNTSKYPIYRQYTNQNSKDEKHHVPSANSPQRYISAKNLPPTPGSPLPTVPVAVPEAVAVQLAPQANPLGQHPPPAEAAQLNHPVAQEPAEAVVAALPVGTATVTPSVFMIVVEDVVGHDVVSQSRPVRQHPPWYTAEQA